MSDDLVKRLRDAHSFMGDPLLKEAADEIERLREALKPFGSYSSSYIRNPETPDNALPANTPHTVGEYRRASAALTDKGEKP